MKVVRYFVVIHEDDGGLHIGGEFSAGADGPPPPDASWDDDWWRFVHTTGSVDRPLLRTRGEVQAMPGGREALRAWEAGDDSRFAALLARERASKPRLRTMSTRRGCGAASAPRCSPGAARAARPSG
jgi:hypothetical protein